MGSSAGVAGFQPSVNGFAFTNSFPPEPDVRIDLGPAGHLSLGDASQGVCGGMVFAVRDYFEAKRATPPDATPPAPGTALFSYLVRRLIDSFNVPAGVTTYGTWMVLPDADVHFFVGSMRGTFSRTVVTSWPQIRADIDGGHPSPIGLVTIRSLDIGKIGQCHQVLGYAYQISDQGIVTLSVYDPNTARTTADSVAITFDSAHPGTPSPITHNIDIPETTLHGFFASNYRPATPPG
jgi:hypothetical protein